MGVEKDCSRWHESRWRGGEWSSPPPPHVSFGALLLCLRFYQLLFGFLKGAAHLVVIVRRRDGMRDAERDQEEGHEQQQKETEDEEEEEEEGGSGRG